MLPNPLQMGGYREHPLLESMIYPHERTTHDPVEWQHVARPYKKGMTFDWREQGSKGKVNLHTFNSKHTLILGLLLLKE